MSKLCITCKEELGVDSFGKDRQRKDGIAINCRPCANTKSKQFSKKAKENYRILVEELTGLGCSHCGYTHITPAPFDWHHIGDKDIEVSRLSRTLDQTKLKEEIAKCIFLCKNCHAIEHERLRKEIG